MSTEDGRWRAVVVAPHFDDAALSVGGLLGRFDGAKAVVTVHGGPPPPGLEVSEWDATCGFVSPEEAYGARVAEDARACALLGADQVVLPNPDGPYLDGRRLAGLDALLAALHPDTEVFLPLGTNQPDHAAVRDRALAVLDSLGRRAPRFYADLPYTAVVAGWGTAAAADSLARDAEHGDAYRRVHAQRGLTVLHDIRLDAGEWSRKRDAILCYASQLAPVGGMSETRDCGALLAYPGPLQSELVWEAGPPSTPIATP